MYIWTITLITYLPIKQEELFYKGYIIICLQQHIRYLLNFQEKKRKNLKILLAIAYSI